MGKEKVFTSDDGTYQYTVHGSLKVNKKTYLTLDRFVVAMKRLRDIVASGVPFEAVDSTFTGDKYTVCSWGLCADTPELYPDRQDWLWPEKDHLIHGRVSPLYKKNQHLCPHDTREKGGFNGCFYTCIFKNVFDRPGTWSGVDREEALARIDKRITEYEARLNQKETL